MKKITFLCWPKPFNDEAEYYPFQRNALLSWKSLPITEKIVVIGDEEGNKEFCEEYGFIHEPEVGEVNEFGTPYMKSILKQGYKHCSPGDPVCYINSDILLGDDFSTVSEWFLDSPLVEQNYLCVGQRWDWKSPEGVDFEEEDWEDKVKNKALSNGELMPTYAIDYFLHKAYSYPIENLPPLAMGRLHWDRWLLGYGIRNFNVIDFSELVLAIHHETSYMLNNTKTSRETYNTSEECVINCNIDPDYGLDIHQSQFIAKVIEDEIKFIKR